MENPALAEACYHVLGTVQLRTLVEELKAHVTSQWMRTVPEDAPGREELYRLNRALDLLIHEIASRADAYAESIGVPSPSAPDEADELLADDYGALY